MGINDPAFVVSNAGSSTPAFYIGGVNQNGRIGLGTTGPLAQLTVSGSGANAFNWTDGNAAGAVLYLQDTNGSSNNGGQILFGASQGTFAGIKGVIQDGTGPAGALVFQTRDSSGDILQRMRITQTGNVGIGTTSLSQIFSVQGNALFSGNISSVANITATGTLALTGTTGTSTIASGQGFTVGTSQLVVQQGSGRVGIGTAVPSVKLHLSGGAFQIDGNVTQNTAINNALTITASGGIQRGISQAGSQVTAANNDAIVGFGSFQSINNSGAFIGITNKAVDIHNPGGAGTVDTNYGLYLENQTRGTTNYSIYSAGANNYFGGNVGIGTTSPSQTLAVHGNALFSGNISSVANITATGTLALTGTTGTSTIASGQGFTVGSSQFVVEQGSGKVGIATTTSPAYGGYELTIGGTTPYLALISSTDYQGINFQKADVSTGLRSWDFASRNDTFFGNSAGAFAFVGDNYNSGSFDYRVAPLIFQPNGNVILAGASANATNGNVGIGTTSPSQTLAVHGNALFSGNISSVANITATGTLSVTGSASSTIQRLVVGDSTVSTGNYPLHIQSLYTNTLFERVGGGGTVRLSFRDSSGTNHLDVDGGGANDGFSFFNESTELVRIKNSGNVGIGTTTPNWKLQVNGTRPFFTLSDDTAGTNLKHWTMSSQGGNFYVATSSDALATSTAPALTILSNGNVGIGTSSPASRLSIEGTCVDTGAGCADYAELYPATEPVEPGDILMLDTENSGFVKKAQQSNVGGQMSNVALVGAVSTNPAIIIEGSGLQLMTGANYQSNPNKPAVALAGKIPVKVNLEGGEIQIGDPITISSQAGIGKKATESGKIIGYALDQFNEESEMEDGYGKIMVFANLGYYQASQSTDTIQPSTENSSSLVALALEAVKSWLADMQVTIENGIVRLKELVAETITANKAVLNKVQLKDEDTGETYCVRMKSGSLLSTQGACDAPPAEEPAEENSADNSSDQPASETSETEEGATEETATTETATNEQPPQDQNPPETTESTE